MRSPEDIVVHIAEDILPAALDLVEWGIVQGIEFEEDTTKSAVVGIGYGGNSPTTSPDGQPAEVGNPIREYRFVSYVQVSDLQHANLTQAYLGRKMTEIQTVYEDECGSPRFNICAVYDVQTSAQKIDQNTGQVDLTLIIPDI